MRGIPGPNSQPTMLPTLRTLQGRRRVRYRELRASKPPLAYKCGRDRLLSNRKDHVPPVQQKM